MAADDGIVLGFLRIVRECQQLNVIAHIGLYATGFDGEKSFAVVFHIQDFDAELLLVTDRFDDALIGRALRNGNGFPLQVFDFLDAGIGFHQQAGAADEGHVRKLDLLLARQGIGGRAAFQIDRAVRDQWHTRL